MADRHKHVDEVSGIETTGHEWDGIRELDNPMPRWWVYTFYTTIIWAIGYAIAYPSWPLLTDTTKGVLGYSSRAQVATDLADAKAAKAGYNERIAASTVEEIIADPQLQQFAISAGASAFKVNCAQCHGSGAAGAKGFPNLNDDDWLWGGKPEEIYQTIAHGIRYSRDAETRVSEMPAFADMLTPEQLRQTAAFVVSLSATPSQLELADKGKQIFTENCASCHGADAKGNREMGAPNLADSIWLKGKGEQAVINQMKAPKNGIMPAWSPRIGDTTVKELAVFVHSLGGGE
ncbi:MULTISPECIES: cytochrome-c oxidase, cbb3-type subunit III [Sinorhizobium]|uniref:cytochrome-c oxidase, cbb3-type subunit III n=1 Tax=Sinorhizobium TaxID=28105 RepID=UPI00040E73B7|nr:MULTISPECIES: cytochrome-c oxidase, cbb3-type subunit III [Sinorhizobium]WOS67164.1 cytochrome-c oxidase, cbb3-type subunit III [Sinorhizobium fredii GR64]